LLKLPRAQHYDSCNPGNPELAALSLANTVAWYQTYL
jgi:hypothetical protein